MKFPTFRTFHRFSSAPPLCAPWLVRGATSHCVEYKSKGFDYNVRRNRRNATTVLEITPLSTERERERGRLHAVGHDSILIGIVVSDLGRSSCPLLSLSPLSFSHPRFLLPIYPVMNIESIFI